MANWSKQNNPGSCCCKPACHDATLHLRPGSTECTATYIYDTTVTVTDPSGHVIYEGPVPVDLTIDLDEHDPGTYQLQWSGTVNPGYQNPVTSTQVIACGGEYYRNMDYPVDPQHNCYCTPVNVLGQIMPGVPCFDFPLPNRLHLTSPLGGVELVISNPDAPCCLGMGAGWVGSQPVSGPGYPEAGPFVFACDDADFGYAAHSTMCWHFGCSFGGAFGASGVTSACIKWLPDFSQGRSGLSDLSDFDCLTSGNTPGVWGPNASLIVDSCVPFAAHGVATFTYVNDPMVVSGLFQLGDNPITISS